MRQAIDDRRRREVTRQLSETGDQEAIRATFAGEFGFLARKREHMQEVIRRVDERLEQGEDNTYHDYRDVAQDFMEELSPHRKTEDEQRSGVIEEMRTMRPGEQQYQE